MGLSLELVKYHLFQFLNRIRAGIDVDITKKMICAEKSARKSEFSYSPSYNMGNPNGGVVSPPVWAPAAGT